MGEDPEQQIAILQSQLRERLAQLRPHRPGSEAHTKATDAVIQATTKLIDYEERLPLLLDRAPRRLSLLIVRWSGMVPTGVGVSVTVAALAGWVSRWWLLMVIVLLVAAILLLRLPVYPPGDDRHLTLRPGSIVVAFGSLLVAIDVALRFPLWLSAIGFVLMVAGLWHAHQSAPGGP